MAQAGRNDARLIFVLALVLRLAYLFENASSPEFTFPVLDSMCLDDLGMDVAAGKATAESLCFRGPLYPLLLGAVYALGPSVRFVSIRIVQHLLGALTCVALAILGRKALGRGAGLVAGCLAAVYGPLVFCEGEILIETLFIFLLASSLCLMVAGGERGNLWLLAGGGLALGLSTAARANALVVLPAALLWVLLAGRAVGLRGRLLRVAAVMVPAAAVLGVVSLRNYAACGEFVLVSSQGGVNFCYGNCRGASGMPPPARKTYGASERYRDGIEVASVQMLSGGDGAGTPGRVSDSWYRIALRGIAADKAAWVRLMWKKAVLFMGSHEISNNRDYYFAGRYSLVLRALRVPFGVIAAFGIAGAAAAVTWRRSAAGGLLVLYSAAFTASVVLFFVCGRLRLPVVVGLIPLAGGGVVHLAGLLRDLFRRVGARREGTGGGGDVHAAGARARVWCGILVPLVLVASFIDWYGISKEDFSEEYWIAGKCRYNLGQYREAAEEFLQASRLDPSFPGSHFYLGNCLCALGDFAAAASSYEIVRRLDPGNARPVSNLGACAEKTGRPKDAEQFYREAAAMSADFAKPRANLGMLLLKHGRLDEGRDWLVSAAKLDSGDPEAWLGLALYAHLSGNVAAREWHLARAVRAGGARYRELLSEAIREAGGRE